MMNKKLNKKLIKSLKKQIIKTFNGENEYTWKETLEDIADLAQLENIETIAKDITEEVCVNNLLFLSDYEYFKVLATHNLKLVKKIKEPFGSTDKGWVSSRVYEVTGTAYLIGEDTCSEVCEEHRGIVFFKVVEQEQNKKTYKVGECFGYEKDGKTYKTEAIDSVTIQLNEKDVDVTWSREYFDDTDPEKQSKPQKFTISPDAVHQIAQQKNNDKENPDNIVAALKTVVGAENYDGDASSQVLLPIAGGGRLRVGVTDDDVGTGNLWFDHYEGLQIVGGSSLQEDRFGCPECKHKF